MPGAFNAYSALLIEQAGFSAYYISGAGLANAVFGVPDIGIPTLPEAAEHARRIDQTVSIPGISDADTGFENISATIKTFEASGVAGIHLEDQQTDKRCGHLEGKKLISAKEMGKKIEKAITTKKDKNFLVIARTDAAAVEGFDAALKRAKLYEDAGADAIFTEALTSEKEFAAFRQAIKIPLLANMTEFGKTPYLSIKKFEALGMNMVIFPMTLFRVAAKSMQQALVELKQKGTQKGILEKMQTRQELYKLLKYNP